MTCTPVDSSIAAHLYAFDFNGAAGQISYLKAHHYSSLTEGDCNGSSQNLQQTNGWAYSADRNTRIGSMFCYTGTDGRNALAWTYDDTAVMLTAIAGPSHTHAELYTWWIGQTQLALR